MNDASAAAAPKGRDIFPYRIPGPAGFGISHTANRSRAGSQAANGSQTPSAPTQSHSLISSASERAHAARARPFDTPAWHALLRSNELCPYGGKLLSSSVALVKNNALNGVFTKSRLAVRVERMNFVGKDASVTLADPTGIIVGTLLAEIFTNRKSGVEEGAVLMLKGVSAIMFQERRVAGFRANLNDALHISIQSANVERVFGICDDMELPRKEGILPYQATALVEPKVSQQALRRQRSTPATPRRPLSRVPHRPSSVHNGMHRSSNNGRSYSTPERSFDPPGRGRPHGPYGVDPNSIHQGPHHGRGRGYRGRTHGEMYSSSSHGRQQAESVAAIRVGLQARTTSIHPGLNNSGAQQSNRDVTKRPSTQSFQLPRPSQRPRLEAKDRIPPVLSAPVENTAADVLTDDQLDNLLGSVDIDAVIAAATQSTSPQGKENKSSDETQNPGGINVKRPAHELSNLNHDVPEFASTTPETEPKEQSASPLASSTPALKIAAEERSGDNNVAKGIGNIDDSMLDSLLDGLDSTDFA